MSGGITAVGALAAVSAASAAYGIYSGEKQRSAQKKAGKEAEEAANKQASQAEQEMNRARTNAPDTSALLQQAAQAGGSNTLLTGSQGVDPNQLQLGKNTLLGG